MWRYVVFIILISLLITGGVFLVTFLHDPYLPIIEPFVCDPEQELTAEIFTVRRGSEIIISGFYCMSGADRVNEVTALVILIAMLPAIAATGLFLLTGLSDYNSRRNVLYNGDKGVGRITDIGYTGMRVNEQPVYKVTMEVFSHGRDTYTATTKKRFGYFGISGLPFGIGALLPLRIDPRRPQRVFIEDNAEVDPFLAKMAGGIPAGNVTVNGVTVTGSNIDNLGTAGRDAVNQILRQFNVDLGSTTEADDRTLTEKLRELQDAYNSGLINAQEYEIQRKRLLDTL